MTSGVRELEDAFNIFGSIFSTRGTSTRKARPRDQQRVKLYRAEDQVFKKAGQSEFQTLSQCQTFLNELKRDKVLARWYPKLKRTMDKVELHPGMGRRSACCECRNYGYVIKLPIWARSRWVICHELAHALNAEMHGRNSISSHGWEFARIFMFLVQRGISKEESKKLQASFKKNRVKFTKPKPKRELSPERKAELQERMKKMQEARRVKREMK